MKKEKPIRSDEPKLRAFTQQEKDDALRQQTLVIQGRGMMARKAPKPAKKGPATEYGGFL